MRSRDDEGFKNSERAAADGGLRRGAGGLLVHRSSRKGQLHLDGLPLLFQRDNHDPGLVVTMKGGITAEYLIDLFKEFKKSDTGPLVAVQGAGIMRLSEAVARFGDQLVHCGTTDEFMAHFVKRHADHRHFVQLAPTAEDLPDVGLNPFRPFPFKGFP